MLVDSPPSSFGNRGLTLPSSPARTILSGAGFSQRPFTLSQRLSATGPPFRGQCSRPAASNPCRIGLQTRTIFCSSAHAGFDPVRAVSTLRPVVCCLSGTPGFSSDLHSPSGLFVPSGSKRSTDLVPGNLAFRLRPISLRSPPPMLFESFGCGSTFRVRYASGSLLFFKPLGTFFIMRHCDRIVKGNLRKHCTFPQRNRRAFAYDYRACSVDSLWIKRSARNLFAPAIQSGAG